MSISSETRTALAAYAHEAWSGWMKYLFDKSAFNQDGTVTIPAWAVERWLRQSSADFHALPESEQKSDYAEADRMIAIVSAQPSEGRPVAEQVQCYDTPANLWPVSDVPRNVYQSPTWLDCCARCGQRLDNISPGFSVTTSGGKVCANCLAPGEEIARARSLEGDA